MKTVIFTATFGMACISTFAQGALNFANAGQGVNAPVVDLNGNRLSGNTWAADLYWAPGVVTDSTVLTALGAPATFSTVPSQAGYFFGGSRTIPGQPGGSLITAQVRVWDYSVGPTWGSTLNGGGAVGESILFQVTLTAPPQAAANLFGLNGRVFTAGFVCLSCNQPWPVAVVVRSNGPNGLLLCWPAYFNAGRYRVQQIPDLNSTQWETLPNQPALVAQPPIGTPEFQVAVTKPAGTLFYRLVWQ